MKSGGVLYCAAPTENIVALCDVDDSVMAMGCKMMEDAGRGDYRKWFP